MWVARELLRLCSRSGFAVLIAVVIAETRAVVSGGDMFWTFRVVLMLLGALYLLLAAGPGASLDGRKVTHMSAFLGVGRFDHIPGPKLTATATFIASGVLLLALGLAL
jgi:hypothetical protein